MDKSARTLGTRIFMLPVAVMLLLGALSAPAGASERGGVAAPPERSAASVEVLSFGVVPQQATRDLVERWTPLLLQLGARSGIALQFETARDIPTFERRVLAGDYDLVYMNPYHYTVFHETTGYTPLVKEADAHLQGILVVQADSSLRTLDELRYVASHDSVFRAVAMGLYPAGGAIMRTFNALDPALRAELRILWTTPALTPHPVAVHPRIDPAVARRLQLALLQLDRAGDDADLLAALGFNGFEPARDVDYDDVRARILVRSCLA